MRSRLSSQGQVELPKEICEVLGLQPGVYLEVRVEDGRIILQPIPDDGLTSNEESNDHPDPVGALGAPGRDGVERPREFYDRVSHHKDFREILKRLA